MIEYLFANFYFFFLFSGMVEFIVRIQIFESGVLNCDDSG